MAKVSIFLKPSKDKEGKQQIYIQLIHQGKRKNFFTGERTKPSEWDVKRKRLKGQVTGAFDINKRLDELIDEANRIIRVLKYSGNDFSIDELSIEFEGYLRPHTKKPDRGSLTWETLFAEWITENEKSKAPFTIRNYTNAKNKFKEYLKERVLLPVEITPDVMDDYIDWLMDSEGKETSYVEKMYITLRKFLKGMAEKSIPVTPEILVYKPKRKIQVKVKPAIFLTDEEFIQLYNYQPEKDYLKKAKDIYILLHTTGLRHSDSKIDSFDVVNGRIVKDMQKTGKKVRVPITDFADEIMKKYNNKPPHISSQKINDYLKELFKAAEINAPVKVVSYKGGKKTETVKEKWEVASTKIGRKSLVSAMIKAGINERVIREITGHSKPINLEPYAGVSDSTVDDALRGVFKKKG